MLRSKKEKPCVGLLLLGAQAVGKSLLMRQLKRRLLRAGGSDPSGGGKGSEDTDDPAVMRADTIATVGFEVQSVAMPRGSVVRPRGGGGGGGGAGVGVGARLRGAPL